MKPFRIEISDADLDDLRTRLSRTRWPRQLPGDGWSRGVPLDYLRPARAFHVVVPSVPGFGFSSAPAETGFTVDRVARMWVELMRRLGYERYGTQGGDLGAYLAPEVARVAPEHVVGVHIDAGFGMPTAADVPDMDEAERVEWKQLQQWMSGGVDHHALLRTAPMTFSYAWNDSPVALLAWLMHKFKEFTFMVPTPEQAIARDHLLTNASLYWFTGTSGTSSWPMYERMTLAEDGGFAWPKGQKRVPSGVYAGGSALMRRLAERDNQIVHWPEGNTGGHFVAMEKPLAHAADIRAFFDGLR